MAENKLVTGAINLLTGVITPFIAGRGPPCRNNFFFGLTYDSHRLPVMVLLKLSFQYQKQSMDLLLGNGKKAIP